MKRLATIILFASCLCARPAAIFVGEGDSIVEGCCSLGANITTSNWVAAMNLPAIYPGAYTTNLGHRGDTLIDNTNAFDILRTLTNSTSYTKRTVSLFYGWNDYFGGYSMATVTNGFRTIVGVIRSAFPDTYIIAQTLQRIGPAAYSEAQLQAMESYRLGLNHFITNSTGVFDLAVDIGGDSRLTNYAATGTYYDTDKIHLLEQGYRVIADIMLGVLSTNGRMSGDWYVRAGATGSGLGTDWSNAWTNTGSINWSNITAGDSIWFAGGTYSALHIGASGTAANRIGLYRVRSTNSTPVSAAGWSGAFDSQVVFESGIAASQKDGWIVDGQIPFSGILLTNSSITTNYDLINLHNDTLNNITLKNMRCSGGIDRSNKVGVAGYIRGIGSNMASSGAGTNFLLSGLLFEYVGEDVVILHWRDAVFESCIFKDTFSGDFADLHSGVFYAVGCTNLTIRRCIFTNYMGEGILLDFSAGNEPNDSVWIHNNLFADGYPASRVLETQATNQIRVRFFNNTVVNVPIGFNAGNAGTWHSTCQSSNNIWFNASACEFGQGFDDYNLTDSTAAGSHSISGAASSIFVNYSVGDYHTVTNVAALFPAAKGANLGDLFAVDLDGNSRSAPWDIGAFVASGTNSPSSDPAPTSTSLVLRVRGKVIFR